MKVIIVGDNLADIVTAKPRDLDKHFIQIRKQLYKLYPEQFYRCRIIRKGCERESEEISCFMENSLYPFHTNGVKFDQETVLAELWEHKCTEPKGLFGKFRSYISAGLGWGRAIYPFIGIIITLVIVVGILISNGGLEL